MSPTVLGCFLGVAQGMCHAVEPDHLAAVSTLVAEQNKPRSILRFAAAWGAGHALVLLVVGGTLLLVGAKMPPSLADACELVVAAMLVFLGVRALRAARSTLGVAHTHGHGHHTHAATPSTRPPRSARRAAIIGMVHGLAGSGAITALVLTQLMSPLAGLSFIALYGFGAALGMSIIAGIAGVPLSHVTRNARGAPLVLRFTGMVSVVLGAAWAWPIAKRWITGG